jgi:CelD/BcsL family acetyltransferase involved in cellulose biosynthesis
MQVEILSPKNGLSDIKGEWNRLLQRCSHSVFSSFDVVESYYSHCQKHGQIRCILLREEKEVVGLVPMIENRKYGYRQLTLVGRNDFDYHELLCVEGYWWHCFDAMMDVIGNSFAILENLCVPAEFLERFSNEVRQRWPGATLTWESAPSLIIDGTWEQFLEGRRKRTLKDTERQIRRLHNLGKIEFKQARTLQEMRSSLDLLHHFKSGRQYSDMVTRNATERPFFREFLLDISAALLNRGVLDLCALELDGYPIAVHVGFVFGDRYYYYIPAFNMQYAQYSVGRILMVHAIEEAFSRKLKEFDFLRGDEKYKLEWSTGARQVFTIRLYPSGCEGKILRLWTEWIYPALSANPLLRKIVKYARSRVM